MTKKDKAYIVIVWLLIGLTLIGFSAIVVVTDVRSVKHMINYRLDEINQINNQLLDDCNWDVPTDIAVDLYDTQLKVAWNNFSHDNNERENLSSCSKINLCLEERGIL